ncbi:MAG: hypothetical protein JNK82_08185 [Myxococcaceae bacterium]|nr:hypothetical protein [Myxococcaceae bacterium]
MRRLSLLLAAAIASGCGGYGKQAPECARWVSCAEALPGAVKGSMDAAYGPAGNCWLNDAQAAQNCVSQCKSALAAQAAMPNAPEACK